MRVAIVSIAIVVAAAIGGFVGYSIRTGPGPIDDHDPVGFNLATPAPSAGQSAAALTFAWSPVPASTACMHQSVQCYLTIRYLANPSPCTGGSELPCQTMTCPGGAQCATFHGPISVSFFEDQGPYHRPTTKTVDGIMIFQPALKH